jgi:hypothetical protein
MSMTRASTAAFHYRFDQEEGGRLGREVATYVVKHNLSPVHGQE